MRRRYANQVDDNYQVKRFDDDIFKGYVYYSKFKSGKALIVNNGVSDICIKNIGYEWLQVYPDDAKYAITIMFDSDKKLIEWYFDIAKEIGIDNDICYEDDLYLDMVIMPDGKSIVLDEDELVEALHKGEVTQSDADNAYKVLGELKNKYVDHFDDLISLTTYLYDKF